MHLPQHKAVQQCTPPVTGKLLHIVRDRINGYPVIKFGPLEDFDFNLF